MKHTLEIENEELQKSLEETYDEITRIDMEIARYAIYDMVEQMNTNTVMSNSILASPQAIQDILMWSNNK